MLQQENSSVRFLTKWFLHFQSLFCFSFLFLVHLLHSIRPSVCLSDVNDRCIVGSFTDPVLLIADDDDDDV